MGKKIFLVLAVGLIVILGVAISNLPKGELTPGDVTISYSPAPRWLSWLDVLPWVELTTAKRDMVIYNNKADKVTYELKYCDAPDSKNGYIPWDAGDRVSIGKREVTVQPETYVRIPVKVKLPQNGEAPDKWQFLIHVKEPGQSGWIQTAYAVRWFVSVRR